ncbi:MAG: hypothetical protein KGN35_07435 [Betaproteobacteria bacterium]|nr:hypothetical protein [Betaproteobacteria bacterium]
MGLNVSILKVNTVLTVYTCPANTVAEIEMVAADGPGGTPINVVSNGVTTEWIGGGQASLKKSFTATSGSASSDNSLVEDTGGGTYVLRPRFVRLTAGDVLSIGIISSPNRKCTFIIYEQSTGAN